MKNMRVFDLKFFNFLEMKVSIYLNRHVFVMVKLSYTNGVVVKALVVCHVGSTLYYLLAVKGSPSTAAVYVFIYSIILSSVWHAITKTCLYNFDPLKPHFYIIKLGFTGVYIIFLISAQNIDCGYSLEPHRRGSSNEYPQSMFCAEI